VTAFAEAIRIQPTCRRSYNSATCCGNARRGGRSRGKPRRMKSQNRKPATKPRSLPQNSGAASSTRDSRAPFRNAAPRSALRLNIGAHFEFGVALRQQANPRGAREFRKGHRTRSSIDTSGPPKKLANRSYSNVFDEMAYFERELVIYLGLCAALTSSVPTGTPRATFTRYYRFERLTHLNSKRKPEK